MAYIDLHNHLQNLKVDEIIELELGCGENKRNKNYIGIDAIAYEGVDIIGDVYEILESFPKESVDLVYSSHFIEHVDDLNKLFVLLERVLKPTGKINFIAPHFSNPYFYSDPTHKSTFGLYTMCYFSMNKYFNRQVPTYQKNLFFEIEEVCLIFKSPKPFYIRYLLKKVPNYIFNLSIYMKELYEDIFCYLIPCYEVKYILKKSKIK